jgi:hypothetical protein
MQSRAHSYLKGLSHRIRSAYKLFDEFKGSRMVEEILILNFCFHIQILNLPAVLQNRIGVACSFEGYLIELQRRLQYLIF